MQDPALARLYVVIGSPGVVSVIDERSLEDWEAGPLVAQPMALLCRVIDRLEDSYAAERRNELYLRVCRLDPLQAMALQRGG